MFELLFQLLFWGGIIALVVWLVRRDQARSYVDYDSKSYAQGYWDGYRAHQKEAGIEETEPTAAQAAVSSQPLVAESLSKTPETKEKHDLQNINMTLYVASFLLVAAAALFVGTALDPAVKFVGTWLITIAFYGGGLAIHKRMPKLRPAAVAFTGTGLALLPFTGLAMYSFVLPDAALSWLITSIIGVVMFVYASMRLQSQVVAYFAIAFMVSMASASVATLGAGLLWYFVVLIGVGALATITASVKPRWLPEVFSRPIVESARWIVPLTLIVGVLCAPFLQLYDYEVIAAVAALYYVAVAVSSPVMRAYAISMARAMISLFVILVAYDVSDSWAVVGGVITVVGALQAVASTWFLLDNKQDKSGHEAWLWIGFALQVIAPLFVLAEPEWALYLSLQLIVLAAVSIGVALLLRRSSLLYFAVYAGVLLPFVFGIYHLRLTENTEWVAIMYLLLGAGAVAARALTNERRPMLRPVLVTAYALYLAEALAVAASASLGWIAALWIVTAAILYAVTMIERQAWMTLIANAVLLCAFGWLFELMNVSETWRGSVLSWVAFGIFYGAYWAVQSLPDYKKHGRFMMWSAIGVAGALGLISLGSANFDVVIAGGLTVLVVALALAFEGENRRQLGYYDAAAVLATIGLQRMVAEVTPELDGLVYSHWWALVLAGLAYIYYRAGQSAQAKPRLIAGLIVLSLFSGAAALDTSSAWTGDTVYRLIFLLEHAILLVAGLAFSYKLLSIWGAVGVVLAVLWLLSGYTFLLLLFVGLGLIGGAVYALLKKSKNS